MTTMSCCAVLLLVLLQVCIQGIPWKYTEEDLGGLVAECGEVEKSEVMTSPDGRSKVRRQAESTGRGGSAGCATGQAAVV
jgi:hypothetical protein